jgi:hypothetical protein
MLPINMAPKYTTLLPTSGLNVEYRPFLVKEQKSLVLAKEGNEEEQTMKAIKDLLRSVTEGKVEPNDLPVVDMEWLFLKVRSVSVGETAKVNLQCQQTDCVGSGETTINLEEVVTEGSLPEDATIMITDTVGVKVRVPSVGMLEGVVGMQPELQSIEILKKSLVQIFDEDSIYHCNELSNEEVDGFVDNLTFGQLTKLGEFFDDLPKLTYNARYKCDVCGTVNNKKLEGLQSFF